MMKEGDKISHAHMHQEVFIPGLNKRVKKGMDAQEFPGLEMYLGFAGLDCTYKDRSFVVPYVNFQTLVAEPTKGSVVKNDKVKK